MNISKSHYNIMSKKDVFAKEFLFYKILFNLLVFSQITIKRVLSNFENWRLKGFLYLFPMLLSSFIFYSSFFLIKNQTSKYTKSHFGNTHMKNSHINSLLHRFDTLNRVGSECEIDRIDQGRYYDNVSIMISDCFFMRSLVFSGDGGVIRISTSTQYMSISYSTFSNCSCSGYGGAIYFQSTNSSMKMICATNCDASYCHFSYLRASKVNQVEFLSVTSCSCYTSGFYVLFLQTGDQRVDNTNISMNNANQVSGILINNPFSFTSLHCTFSNNKVMNSFCLCFWSNSGTMSFANIVHNNSPSNGVVFIDGGSPKMKYCIFQNNQNILFCVWSGSLEVSHSFIGHSSISLSTSTSVLQVTNNSLTTKMTYNLQFFISGYCNADNPLVIRTQMITIEQRYNRLFIFLYSIVFFLIL